MTQRRPIPVIDLFAGPGGLGEGFSSIMDPLRCPHFSLKVSVEKDPTAHKTLSLRSLYRKFPRGKAPDCYYDHIRGEISREALFAHPDAAEEGREALEEALISANSCVHGITRFISSKNSRLRVRLVTSSNPVVARLICCMAQLSQIRPSSG